METRSAKTQLRGDTKAMKITSITPLQPGSITLKTRDTQSNKNVETIMENLRQTKTDLVIAGDDMQKYERYALQRKLQNAGAKVIVQSGTNAQKKPVLVIHRLTDAEWKEYQAK